MNSKFTVKNVFILFAVLSVNACSSLFHDSHKLTKGTHSCECVKTKSYHESGFFASTNLFLNSDSTFLLDFDTGCFGESKVAFGRYRVVGDSIELVPTPKDQLDPICSLILSGPRKRLKRINFLIRDNTGGSVNELAILPLPLNANELKMNRKSPGYYRQYMTNYDGVEGGITINTEKRDSVEIPQITNLTGKRYSLAVKDLARNVLIVLRINDPGFAYRGTEYEPPAFLKLHQSADTLTAFGRRLVK